MPRRTRRGGRRGSAAVPVRSDSVSLGDRTAVFQKTKMCKFHILGVCLRGHDCAFAHDQEELQPLPDLFRTKLCKALLSDGVCNDASCRYAHNADELRPVPAGEDGEDSSTGPFDDSCDGEEPSWGQQQSLVQVTTPETDSPDATKAPIKTDLGTARPMRLPTVAPTESITRAAGGEFSDAACDSGDGDSAPQCTASWNAFGAAHAPLGEPVQIHPCTLRSLSSNDLQDLLRREGGGSIDDESEDALECNQAAARFGEDDTAAWLVNPTVPVFSKSRHLRDWEPAHITVAAEPLFGNIGTIGGTLQRCVN